MSEGKTKLSLEEFLAISTDYNENKAAIKKAERRNTALGVMALILSMIISIVIFCTTFNIILVLIILLATMIPSIVFLSRNESKSKEKLEKYGADLYREYLKENNFI